MDLDLQPLGEAKPSQLDLQPLDTSSPSMLDNIKGEIRGIEDASNRVVGGTLGYLGAGIPAAANRLNEAIQGRGNQGSFGQDFDTLSQKISEGLFPSNANEPPASADKYNDAVNDFMTNFGIPAMGVHGSIPVPKGMPKPVFKDMTKFNKLDSLDEVAKKTSSTPLDIQPLETPPAVDPNIDLYKQHAADLQQSAQAADAAKGQEPLAVSPEGITGTPAEMEGLRASTQDITYENVPPDGVIPRTKPDGSVEVPKGNTWIPDENNIPVRQGLPEEAPGEPPIQNVLNNTPEVNALGNAIQEANGPKLGIDDTYGSGALGSQTELPPEIARTRSARFGGGQSGSAPIINDLATGVSKLISKLNDIGSKGIGHLTSREEYFSKNIPGMKDPIGEHIPVSDTPEKIVADGMKSPDIPDLGMMSNVQSGAILTSAKFRDNPILLGVGRILNEGAKTAEYYSRQLAKPVMDQLKSLSTPHRIEVAELLKREMKDGKRYTPEQLLDAGFTKKQIDSYDMYRKAQDVIFEKTNAQRAAVGQEPITRENAYLASMRTGDWQFAVNTKDGKPVWFVRSASRAEAKAAIEYLRKNHGDSLNLDKTVPEFRKDGSKYAPGVPKDVMGVYQDMIKAFTDKPDLSAAVRDGLNKYLDQKGYGALGHKGHFMETSKIRGFEGDKPWLSDSANANALMKAQGNYMHNALQWMSMQDSMAKLKPILSNEELSNKSPNALNYVEQVVDSQFGQNNGVLSALESSLAQMTGRSQSTLYKSVTGIKSALYLQTLGINMAHFLATVTQPFITAPAQHAVLSAKGMKYNIVSTALKSMTDFAAGMARHEAHSLTGNDVHIPMTNIGERALQYAEDNGIISKNIYDESSNMGGNAIGNIAKAITSPTISLPEKMARLSTFMSFVHHLDESGKFPDTMQLMRKAEEMTDKSLTSYRAADRPMIVNKLGATGNLAYTFKSYLFNEFNQLSELGRLAGQGKHTPLITHLAMLGLVGGALSIPTLNEADGVWNLFKDAVANNKPEWYPAISGNGLKASIIQHLSDLSSYGAVSKLTGAALQSRYGTDVVDPEHPLKGLFPMYQDIKEAASATKVLAHPTDSTAWTEAAYQQMPDAIKGNMENRMSIFQGPGAEGMGNPTTINPNKLEDSRAMDYRRTEQDKAYRSLGLHSLAEVKAKQTSYINAEESKRIETATKRAGELLFNAVRKGDKEDAQKYGKAYLQLNPDNPGEDHIKGVIDQMINASAYTPSERNAMAAKSIQQLQNVKRLMDTQNANKP